MAVETRIKVGQLCTALRVKAGMNEQALADAARIPLSRLKAIEAGDMGLIDTLRQVFGVLGYDVRIMIKPYKIDDLSK